MKDRYQHAKERFLKRYKRRIETEQINALEYMIQQNKVSSMSSTLDINRIQVALQIGEEKIHCIYSKLSGQIITFIDPNERKHQRKKHNAIPNGNRRTKNRRN